MVKRFGWMCWKVVECVLEFAGYGILFSAPVFFLVDLSAKTTKPEVDFSTWKDTQGRGRRVVQLAEAARETQTGCIWLLYLGSLQACQGHVPQDLWSSYEFLILRWYGDPKWMTPVKTANKKKVKSQSCSRSCFADFLFSDHVSLRLLNERPQLFFQNEPWHFSWWFGSCQSGRWEWHRLLKALIWLDDLSSLVNWKDLNRLSNQIKSWVCSDKKWRIAISIKQDSEFMEWIKQSFTGRRVVFAENSHESWIHHKRFNDSQLCNRWDKARLMHLWSSTGTGTARVAYVHVVFLAGKGWEDEILSGMFLMDLWSR